MAPLDEIDFPMILFHCQKPLLATGNGDPKAVGMIVWVLAGVRGCFVLPALDCQLIT